MAAALAAAVTVDAVARPKAVPDQGAARGRHGPEPASVVPDAVDWKAAEKQRADKGRPKWSKRPEDTSASGSDEAERSAPRPAAAPSLRPTPRHAPRVQAPITDAGRSVRVSRIFHVPASAIFRAINDLDKRGWAPDPLYKIVSVLAPRFIRLAFPDGSLVGVAVMRQGNARCTVSVEHSRIPDGATDAQVRDRWTVALAALAEQIDTGWD
jgi:hypothetical protein